MTSGHSMRCCQQQRWGVFIKRPQRRHCHSADAPVLPTNLSRKTDSVAWVRPGWHRGSITACFVTPGGGKAPRVRHSEAELRRWCSGLGGVPPLPADLTGRNMVCTTTERDLGRPARIVWPYDHSMVGTMTELGLELLGFVWWHAF